MSSAQRKSPGHGLVNPVGKGMRLTVSNNTVRATNVPPVLANALDLELRYPTLAAGQVDPSGWDGWVRLLHKQYDGSYTFPTGLLPIVHRFAQRLSYEYQLDDQRERPAPGSWSWAKQRPDGYFRPYQLKAIEKTVLAGCGVIDSPPRSGKTAIMTEVVRRIALPTLWIAPTDRICKQTLAVLKSRFGEHHVMHLVGQRFAAGAMSCEIVVATVNTAYALPEEWFKHIQLLVVDEWHHAAAKMYHTVFTRCAHVFYRLGMTGTHYRSGDDALAMQSLLSNTIFKIESKDLVELGYLVPGDVVFLPVNTPKMRGLGPSWSDIARVGIWACIPRNQLIAEVAGQLAKAGRKVLVLCNIKEQGNMLRAMLRPMFHAKHPLSEFETVEFCSTDMPRWRIDKVVESFNELDEIKVLIGTSMLGEGVDLPAADALVYARGEKAEVSLTQNVFRVCTAAQGKPPRSLVVDFADWHHRKLADHAMERMSVYYGEPIFHVQAMDVPTFQNWLVQSGHLKRLHGDC